MKLSLVISGSLVVSLFISWILFLISYYLKIPGIGLFFVFLSLVMLSQFWKRYNNGELNEDKIFQVNYYLFLVLGIAFYTLILFLDYLQTHYTISFIDWDAVVSWNRWAIELSNNRYRPLDAAYPILFPAIWSLIYKIQLDINFWLVTKASLIFLPLSIFAYTIALSIERRQLFPILASLFFLIIFQSKNHMVNGYMDMPVSELGFLSCILFWDFLTKSESEKEEFRYYPLYFSLLAAALASITKQPGSIFLLLILCMTFYFNKSWEKDKKHVYFLCLFSILPILSFILFFIDHSVADQLVGNYNKLSQLTIGRSKGNILLHAWNSILNFIGMYYLITILFLSILAFFFSNKEIKKFLFACLIAFVVSSIIWIHSFSYDIRNYYFAISILIVLATIGMQGMLTTLALILNRYSFIKQIALHRYNIPYDLLISSKKLIISMPLLLTISTSIVSMESWQKINLSARTDVPFPSILVVSSIEVQQSPDSKIITDWQPLKFVPGFEKRYRGGSFRNLESFKNHPDFSSGNFLFIGTGASPEVFEFIKKSLNEGKLIQIQKPYGFYKIK